MQGQFCAIKQAGTHEVLGQPVLGTVALGRRQVGTTEQVLVHAHGPLVFTTPAKQVAQCEVQIAGVGVLLNGLDEGVNGLVVLFVEQKIQPLEVGLGVSRWSPRIWRISSRDASHPSAKATGSPSSTH
jgi:hypothetical protein